jgi:hypothetical protein
MPRNGGNSPDEADALMMLLHAVRMNTDVVPGLVEAQVPGKNLNEAAGIKFTSVKSWGSIEHDDAICADGSED